MARIIAHISDLHVGRSSFTGSLKNLCNSLHENNIHKILLTGDVTEGGTHRQLRLFNNIFKSLSDKLIIVPGNHDRVGNNIAKQFMQERVVVEEYDDLYVIRVDSTGPHNKWLIVGHGIVCHRVLGMLEEALQKAPSDKFVTVLLHHHLIPIPEESFVERVSKYFGFPFTSELHLGDDLLKLAKTKADLILHGHRHIPFELNLPAGDRPLSIYNAGCTPRLHKYRVFEYENGKQVSDVRWIHY